MGILARRLLVGQECPTYRPLSETVLSRDINMLLTKDHQSSFLRILFTLGAISGAGLIVLGVTQDRNVVEKIATSLAMPAGLLWILMLTLCIQLWRQKKQIHLGQPGAIAATCCFLLYSIAGNGIVANQMATALEADYLTVNPLDESPMDFVIVLGGGGGMGANGRLQGNGSGDRLILAAQLYHQKIAKKLICTGQRIASMDASSVDPADSSREILMKLGVPDSAIETAGGRNTSEEMQNLGSRFKDSKERIGLLTSAWHLPRSLRLAKRNGLQPIPLPADFRSAPTMEGFTVGQIVESIIPNGFALAATWSFGKEYLGMLIGR